MWQPTQPSCSCSCFAVLTWARLTCLSWHTGWLSALTQAWFDWLHDISCIVFIKSVMSMHSCLHSPWYSKWLTHLYVLHWFWNVVSCCLLDFEYCVVWTKPFLQGIPRSWLWRAFHNYCPGKKTRVTKAYGRKGVATQISSLRQYSSIKGVGNWENCAALYGPHLLTMKCWGIWLCWIVFWVMQRQALLSCFHIFCDLDKTKWKC